MDDGRRRRLSLGRMAWKKRKKLLIVEEVLGLSGAQTHSVLHGGYIVLQQFWCERKGGFRASERAKGSSNGTIWVLICNKNFGKQDEGTFGDIWELCGRGINWSSRLYRLVVLEQEIVQGLWGETSSSADPIQCGILVFMQSFATGAVWDSPCSLWTVSPLFSSKHVVHVGNFILGGQQQLWLVL